MRLWPDDEQFQKPTLVPRPVVGARAIVKPLNIFAAGREYFEAIVNTTDAEVAKARMFDALPLEDYGWDFDTARAYPMGERTGGGYSGPVWKLMRA